MNLYLISRPDDGTGGYNEYEGAVVVASDVEDARSIHPGGYDWDGRENYPWMPRDQVVVTYLGGAKKGSKRGVVLSSFNAG